MNILFDFFPIVCFFIAYLVYDIFTATIAAIVASFIQVCYYRFKNGVFQKIHVFTFLTLLILGGLTVLLHDEVFIKWKPTAVYGLLSIALLASHFIGQEPLIQRLAKDAPIKLPSHIWRAVNLSWALFFASMGTLNIYVAYYFSTHFWVNFKLFGTLGLTFAFVIIQSIWLSRYSTEINSHDK